MRSKKIHIHPDVADKNFIPISRRELIKKIITQGGNARINKDNPKLDQLTLKQFRTLTEVIQTIYHARYHRYYLSLKTVYRPFNPDRDVVTQHTWTRDEKHCLQKKLFSEMSALLQKANYEELDEDQINQALNNEMSRGLSIGVELDDYQQVLIYARGRGLIKIQQRYWQSLFLKKREVEIPVYRRLNMAFRFRGIKELEILLKKKGMNRFNLWLYLRRHQRLMQDINSDEYIFLRQFRDIPCSDLEMLFPNSTLRFTLLDKIKLTATGGAGTVGGVMALLSKLTLAIKPLTLIIALIGFGSVLGRQVKNILYQQNHYKMLLSRSLYTHSLDINVGVIATLLDQALDEDVKEAILAYFVLLQAGDEYLSSFEVKLRVEEFMQTHYRVTFNFEVSDALTKLRKDGLVIQKNSNYQAVKTDVASNHLEKHWLDLYSATQSLAEAMGES
jgi:hypothetical protein